VRGAHLGGRKNIGHESKPLPAVKQLTKRATRREAESILNRVSLAFVTRPFCRTARRSYRQILKRRVGSEEIGHLAPAKALAERY
jgi:hypothetical protein